MLHEGFKTKVICGQHLTEEFDIKTGVKQGCILSPFLFCLAIDWIMKRTDIGVKSGITCTFTESVGDLDFADDISLLAHSHRDIQSKTEKLVRNAAKVGLHVNKDKTKTMRIYCQKQRSQTRRTIHRRRNRVYIPGSLSLPCFPDVRCKGGYTSLPPGGRPSSTVLYPGPPSSSPRPPTPPFSCPKWQKMETERLKSRRGSTRQGEHLRLWRTSGRRKWSARKKSYAFSRAMYLAYCYMLQSLGKWRKEYATCWKYSKTSALEEFCTFCGQTS